VQELRKSFRSGRSPKEKEETGEWPEGFETILIKQRIFATDEEGGKGGCFHRFGKES